MIHAVGSMALPECREAYWHPGCFFQQYGEQYVLDLPASERRKFTLGDIGPDLMRELLKD
jgi:hypothetical protein